VIDETEFDGPIRSMRAFVDPLRSFGPITSTTFSESVDEQCVSGIEQGVELFALGGTHVFTHERLGRRLVRAPGEDLRFDAQAIESSFDELHFNGVAERRDVRLRTDDDAFGARSEKHDRRVSTHGCMHDDIFAAPAKFHEDVTKRRQDARTCGKVTNPNDEALPFGVREDEVGEVLN